MAEASKQKKKDTKVSITLIRCAAYSTRRFLLSSTAQLEARIMGCSCFGSSTFLSSKSHLQHSEQGPRGFSPGKNIKLFSYDELKSATDNFSPRNKLGRGGFGTVYKGTLSGGLIAAVKVLSAESRQGVKEFLTEINVITNIRHPNLVELIGCCVEGTNRILVYEYVQNNSLDRALFGSDSDRSMLNWSIRSAICQDIARGLKYLHEELESPIVHRDIKASNILLGRNFSAKIGDFGLAKLFPHNITHISTRVAGTIGYLAPEYAMHGQLTKKADVYSFGVLIIEIISGRSSSKTHWSDMEEFLLERTWELYGEGRLKETVDPSLGSYSEEQVVRFIKVALFCTQAVAARRPDMRQVLEMLSRPVRLRDKELTPPGYVEISARISKDTKSTYSTNPETITEIIPR